MARNRKKQNASMVVNLPKNQPENKNKSRKTKFHTNLKHIVKEQGGFKYWKKAGSRFLEDDERNEVPERAKPLHCPWCEEVFSNVRPLYMHTLCSRACRPYFCQCCGSKFISIKRLAEHSKVHPQFPKKTYTCRSCDKHFDIAGTSHVLPGDENELFQIPSKTPMEVDFNQRPKRVFEVQDSDEEECLSTIICLYCIRKNRISCPFCEVTFPDIHLMTAHCVVHEGYFLYEYACDACDSVFASLPALEDHLSWHERKSVFLCTVCGDKFSCIEDREFHLEHHLLDQNMSALMLKSRNQKYVAKKKYQSTSSPSLTAPVYYCVDCDYSCSTKAGVREHYDSVHPSGTSISRPDGTDEDSSLDDGKIEDLNTGTEEAYDNETKSKEEEKETAISILQDNEMSLPCYLEDEIMELESGVGVMGMNLTTVNDLQSSSAAKPSSNSDAFPSIAESNSNEVTVARNPCSVTEEVNRTQEKPKKLKKWQKKKMSVKSKAGDTTVDFNMNGEGTMEDSQNPTSSTTAMLGQGSAKTKKNEKMNRKGNWLPCGFCKKRFKSIQGLMQHCSIHEQYIFYLHPCKTCGKMITSYQGMVSHMSFKHNQQAAFCGVCGIELPDKKTMGKHLNRHVDVTEIHRLMSKKTNPSFANQSQMPTTTALPSSPGRSTSEDCVIVDVDESSMTCHHGGLSASTFGPLNPASTSNNGCVTYSQEDPDVSLIEFRCNVCNVEFDSPGALEEHSATYQGIPIFVCCICGQVFDNRFDRDSHKTSHGDAQAREKLFEERQINPHFEDAYTRLRQVKHHNEPLMCKYCNKVYMSDVSRRRHLIAKHLPWCCDKCPVQFDNNRKLAYHIRSKHAARTSVLNFYCDTCKQHFKSLKDLESDLSMHESKSVFLCCICALNFDTYRERELHVENHKAYRM